VFVIARKSSHLNLRPGWSTGNRYASIVD